MKELNVLNLAKKNIHNKKSRSYSMIILTFVLCFILFLSSFLIISLKNGLNSLSNRLGADIILVPEGYDSKIESAILRGEPNTFFFDEEVLKRAKNINGIDKATPQLFLATLSAGCCSFPLQIIGVDFETDFSIAPWLKKSVNLPLKEKEIVVGSSIVGDIHQGVKFFNQEFIIKGRLNKTGMGFDTSVFMSMEEVRKLAVEFEKLLNHPVAQKENLISSVMIKVKSGYDIKEVSKALREEFKGEKVYPLSAKSMVSEVSESIKNLLSYVYILIITLWIFAFVILAIVFSFAIRERKREFATLRILGATKKKLNNIVLTEVSLISFIGAISGSMLGFVVSILFGTSISMSLNMPFLEPKLYILIILLIFTVIVGTILGPLSSIISLRNMNKKEMALLLKEN